MVKLSAILSFKKVSHHLPWPQVAVVLWEPLHRHLVHAASLEL